MATMMVEQVPTINKTEVIIYTLLYDSYKDLLRLAETSLHSLWQIMISNSDELKTG